MTYNSLVFAFATMFGPFIGGVIVDLWGWEYCYFINIIIGGIAIILCWKYLPMTPKFVED